MEGARRQPSAQAGRLLDRRATGSRALRPSSVALGHLYRHKYAARATVEASTACAGQPLCEGGQRAGTAKGSLCKASCECCGY